MTQRNALLSEAEAKMTELERLVNEGVIMKGNLNQDTCMIFSNQAEIAGALALICRALKD